MIVGIDFGTTKTVAAVMVDGEPQIITNPMGEWKMPALVVVDGAEKIHVGWEAEKHALTGASYAISSIKRTLGRQGESTWGQLRTYPQEISALILGRMKLEIERCCGEACDEVVLAVPAHFDINQRWATQQAAEIAGFKVLRLVNEAVAAALCYASRQRGSQRIAVFDLGGGTLDISVLEIGDGVIEVIATDGDPQLGGDDFDQRLMDYVTKELSREHAGTLPNDSSWRWWLLQQVERAKCDLSDALEAQINVPFIPGGPEGRSHIPVRVTREHFSLLVEDLVRRCEEACKRCLGGLHKASHGISEVILVGGASRMPAVMTAVEKVFGMRPRGRVDREQAVAVGAALQASIMDGSTTDVLLLDVVPRSLSVGLQGGVASRLIERNTTIPTSKKETFTTTEDNQSEITIHVFEGESEKTQENILVGTVTLRDLPFAAAGIPQIELVFDLDEKACLCVTAKDLGMGRQATAQIEAPYRLNPAQVAVLGRKVKSELSDLKQKIDMEHEAALWKSAKDEAEAFSLRLVAFLEKYGSLLSEELKALLGVGRETLLDYVERHAPKNELQKLLSSVKAVHSEAVTLASSRHLMDFAVRSEVHRWIAGAVEIMHSAEALAEFFKVFREQFADELQQTVSIIKSQESSIRHDIVSLLLEETMNDAARFCLILALEHIPTLDLGFLCREKPLFADEQILSLALLHQLSAGRPDIRDSAARGILTVFRGRECFFLLNYLDGQSDENVSRRLRECLRSAPALTWVKHFMSLSPSERRAFSSAPFAKAALREDACGALCSGGGPSSDELMGILEQTGADGCLAKLVQFLEATTEPDLQWRLMEFILAECGEDADDLVLPFFSMLAKRDTRDMAFQALERLRHLWSEHDEKLWIIATRVFQQKRKPKLGQRLFLWRLERKYKQLQPVVDVLRALEDERRP